MLIIIIIIIIIIITVIIGATGALSKSFRKYVSNIPGNHEVKELQKTAILDLKFREGIPKCYII